MRGMPPVIYGKINVFASKENSVIKAISSPEFLLLGETFLCRFII